MSPLFSCRFWYGNRIISTKRRRESEKGNWGLVRKLSSRLVGALLCLGEGDQLWAQALGLVAVELEAPGGEPVAVVALLLKGEGWLVWGGEARWGGEVSGERGCGVGGGLWGVACGGWLVGGGLWGVACGGWLVGGFDEA